MTDLVLVILIANVIVGIRGVFRWQENRRLLVKVRALEASAFFAESRSELFAAAMSGDVDPSTSNFQALYILNTFVMRRPDNHAEIADMMLDVLTELKFGESGSGEELSPAIQAAAGKTVQGIAQLILNHSRLLRVVASIASVIHAGINVKRVIDKFRSDVISHNKELRVFQKSQSTLEQLQAA